MFRKTTAYFLISIASHAFVGAGHGWTEPPENPEENGAGPPVRFSLPRQEALPGSIVEIAVDVRGHTALSLIATSIEFNPEVLSLLDVRLSDEVVALLATLPGAESELTWIASDEEGWVQAALVFDFEGEEESTLPPGRRPVLVMRFLVAADATPGEAVLWLSREDSAHFPSRFEATDGPVYNAARQAGKAFTPRDKFEERVDAALEDGAVLILPLIGDVGIFLRGDANIDRVLDVSDPVRIITQLFVGSEQDLPCLDAADANDDGHLDISDPIAVLSFLFAGVVTASLTAQAPAADATADTLTCERY